MTEKKNAKFATKWGFILASVGSAVGMANVWGFPAKMGSYGGSAFLIAYLIFIALFGGLIWQKLGIETLFVLSAVLGLCNSAYAATIKSEH